MPINASGQTITIDGSNSGQVFVGDNNQFTMSPGAWTLGSYGMKNRVTGGTGPNTYVISSTATTGSEGDSITTGSGGSIISVTGDWTQITVPNAQTVQAAIAGNDTTILTNDGTASVVAFGNANTVNGGNGADTFLLSGQGNVALLGNGATNAVGIQGDGLVDFQGGTKTFAFLAGSSATGPTIAAFPGSGATFDPSRDHLSVLLSTGIAPGLTDSSLSPQAVLQASQFEQGPAPTQASTRFVYDPSTGVLTYTPNGSASATSVQVATLPTGLGLNASNIFISNRYVFDAPVQNALDSLPAAWGVTDPLPTAPNASNFDAQDVTTGVSSSSEPGETYTGPVSYLTQQLIYGGTHDIVFHAHTNNVFLKSGSGEDALQALGGQNVLDGGTGSNFLVGSAAGAGNDTFFTDARTSQFVWNTVVNFHPGEMITVFGFTAGQSSFAYSPSEGAAGYQGLTLNMDIQGNGGLTAKVTMTGLTTADEGHLVLSTGSVSGIPYLAITNT
jgi:hypothetical protein